MCFSSRDSTRKRKNEKKKTKTSPPRPSRIKAPSQNIFKHIKGDHSIVPRDSVLAISFLFQKKHFFKKNKKKKKKKLFPPSETRARDMDGFAKDSLKKKQTYNSKKKN
jgi:hypothetical protein